VGGRSPNAGPAFMRKLECKIACLLRVSHDREVSG
jgi:hypothetical protein